MKFGIFYELQLPRPWKEGDEHRLYQNALDQIELADKLGLSADQIAKLQQNHSHNLMPPITPQERHNQIPLSFAQQRLWVLITPPYRERLPPPPQLLPGAR